MAEPKILNRIALQGGSAIILYDWMDTAIQDGRNLVLEEEGVVKWRARPPTDSPTDCFTEVHWDGVELKAFALSCYRLTLDPLTGETTASRFTK